VAGLIWKAFGLNCAGKGSDTGRGLGAGTGAPLPCWANGWKTKKVLAGGAVGGDPEGVGDAARVVKGRGDTAVEGAKLEAGVGAAVRPIVVGDGEAGSWVALGMFRGSKSNLIVPAGRTDLAGVGVGDGTAGVGLVPKMVVATEAAGVGRGVKVVGSAVARDSPKVVRVKSLSFRVVNGVGVVAAAPKGAALSFRLSSPWPGMF
jgi:hypothetical protein